mmetsp:Transcript_31238/g.73287  ORF Transcript_31238/g.73287 Transcript_31238/m.73287 type:complete len:205 (-) Transcript_31238:48-662(-)
MFVAWSPPSSRDAISTCIAPPDPTRDTFTLSSTCRRAEGSSMPIAAQTMSATSCLALTWSTKRSGPTRNGGCVPWLCLGSGVTSCSAIRFSRNHTLAAGSRWNRDIMALTHARSSRRSLSLARTYVCRRKRKASCTPSSGVAAVATMFRMREKWERSKTWPSRMVRWLSHRTLSKIDDGVPAVRRRTSSGTPNWMLSVVGWIFS